MLGFVQFHRNVSRGIKTMNLSDSIQSTTCTFGQWFCDAACFLTHFFIQMSVEILPATRLLWLLCSSSSSSSLCGGSFKCWTPQQNCRPRYHHQAAGASAADTRHRVLSNLEGPTACTSVHLQEMKLNVLSRCAIIKRLVIILRPQFTFPPLRLNCW